MLIGSDLRSMVTTIDLYHEPVCRTAEIHDVRADGVLPTKLGVMELPITGSYHTELAAYTALRSWQEASPPGYNVNVA